MSRVHTTYMCNLSRDRFTDGHTVAQGIGRARGDRNVPTIVNRAWGTSFFWDGRAATLERQVLQPILNVTELGMSPEAVLSLAGSNRYRQHFHTAPPDTRWS